MVRRKAEGGGQEQGVRSEGARGMEHGALSEEPKANS